MQSSNRSSENKFRKIKNAILNSIGELGLAIINMQKPRQPLQRILRTALRSKPDDAARPGNRSTDGRVIQSLHKLVDEV